MLKNRVVRTNLLVAFFLYSLHYLGIFDHLAATPFSEFRWPPYVNIKEQVNLRLSGLPSTVVYENDWRYVYNRRLQPRSELCAEGHQPVILIAVKSAVGHFERRKAIRQLWGKERRDNTTLLVATIFILGHSDDASVNDMAKEENEQFGDVLMGGFLDTYRNNTFKLISALQFVTEECGLGVNYVFLVDDDYHVSLRNLVYMLLGSSPDAREDLYAGWRFDSSPFRSRWSKHFTPLSMYPFSDYPPYISAGAVVMSKTTARKIFYASHYVRYYPYDDIFTGIIAYLLDIEPTHDVHFRFWVSWFGYNRDDYLEIVAAHGFDDVDLMRRAYIDSEAA